MLTKPTAQVWWNFCSPMLFSFVYFLIHAAAFVSPSSLSVFWCQCHCVSFHHTWLTNASAFNVARVMEQDFVELSLETSCELFPFFAWCCACVCVHQCCMLLFVQGYCMKSRVAFVSKWMQHWSERIVYILILLDWFYSHFSLLPPPCQNFNSRRLALICSQLCVVLQHI